MLPSNIVVIGSNHVGAGSVAEIKSVFSSFNPDVVCVELDRDRLFALKNPGQKPSFSFSNIRRFGLTGFLFGVVGYFLQQKIGSVVNVKPGSDMLVAVSLAEETNAEVLLLDRPLHHTLKLLSKSVSFREKFLFFKDLFFPPKHFKVSFSLSSVPNDDFLSSLLSFFENRYPSAFKVLVSDRNYFMARRFFHYFKRNPDKKFLVVVGAAHKKGFIDCFNTFYYNNVVGY